MLDELTGINLIGLTAKEILVGMVVAFACGWTIAKLYRLTYKGPGYSLNFANSIIMLSMITAAVIMIIGNNLARAFGLVGAMSIIRFRTAVKETRDIVFIFFALAMGMAAGAGYNKIALLGTIFIGVIVYLLSVSSVTAPKRKEYLLQFAFLGDGDGTPTYLPVFEKYCRRHKVINVKSLGEGEVLELSYYIILKDEEKNNDFVREFKGTHGVEHVNLFFDEERF